MSYLELAKELALDRAALLRTAIPEVKPDAIEAEFWRNTRADQIDDALAAQEQRT